MGNEGGESACLRIAEHQHGLITRAQALSEGISPSGVSRRLQRKRWIPCWQSVYRIAGAPQSWHQEVLAACLWTRGVASFGSAAALWGLEGFRPNTLTVSTSRNVRMPHNLGIEIHRPRSLAKADLRHFRGIPVTSVLRTLLDLSSVESASRLEAALDHALLRGDLTVSELRRRLRAPGNGCKGIGVLKELVQSRSENHDPPHSVLEGEMFRLLKDEGFPSGIRHLPICDDEAQLISEVDLAFPEHQLIIQVDGYRWHGGRKAFDQDLDSRNRLAEQGWKVIHVTSVHLRRRRAALIALLRRVFGMKPTNRGRALPQTGC